MPAQTHAVMNMPISQPTEPTTAPIVDPAVTQQPVAPLAVTPAAPLSTVPAAEPEVTQKHRDILTLSTLGSNLDMMAFKYVILQGKKIDLVYSSDDVAVLCTVLSDDTIWHVDTTQPIENSTWTSDSGVVITPGPELLSQAAVLEKMESNATIIPTVVLVRGKVQDYGEVQDYLLQNHINLVQYQSDQMPGVQTLESLLNEKFLAFPTEADLNEEDNNGSEES